MAHVSLILPISSKQPLSPEQIFPLVQDLKASGHRVEVIVSGVEGLEPMAGGDPSWRWVASVDAGLAAAATAGLRAARGERVLVLDPSMGYSAADLGRVGDALAVGDGELVVASRFMPGGIRRLHRAYAGSIARALAGTSDPLSGLVGLTGGMAERVGKELQPLGNKFAFELVARCDGPWLEVPVEARGPSRRSRLEYDDLRQLKRLADHRFGNVSRLFQFCVVGASGMVVDLSCYAALQRLFAGSWLAGRTAPLIGGSLGLAAARAMAILVALTWNFMFNRRLTFSYARQGSIVRQYVTYALSNALGIVLNFTLGLVLPRYFVFFDRHKLAAAVVGIVSATGISFSMSRWLVFSHRTLPQGRRPSGGHGGGSSSGLHPIPSAPLGAKECGIGALDEEVGPFAGLEDGDPHAGAHPSVQRRDLHGSQGGAQPHGNGDRAHQVGVG
jgi:dolichol-phosphate mannosyltransferase